MEQLSLFDLPNESFYEKLQQQIDDIIFSHHLPQKSIHLYSNVPSTGKNAGKETSKSICIYEPDYPPRKDSHDAAPGKNFIILNIKNSSSNRIELQIRERQFAMIDTPLTAEVKAAKINPSFVTVLFDRNDNSIFSYIKGNILYCLANYESSSSFGCCSRFIECSDAKECVHENKIYSMGCKYRKNLESGKIFYGKNRNID